MPEEAPEIAALRTAVAADPYASAPYKNLAVLLCQSGKLQEARDVLARAVELLPANASLWSRLARVQADAGDAGASMSSLQRTEALAPTDAPTWHLVGSLHAESGRWAQAQRALEAAAALDPGSAAIEMILARANQELGDVASALEGLERAAHRDPGNLGLAVRQGLMLPQIYEGHEDLRDWRKRYTQGLGELTAGINGFAQRAAEVLELGQHNFLLAYQGEDDLELQRGYSRFLAALAARVKPEWQHTRAPDFDGGRRLRVGFPGNIFRDCTAGRYFERWITALDPARFERFVYHTAPVMDAVTRRIAAGCEHFVVCRSGNVDTIARIATDRLDVLVQPDVGMTPLSYLLSAVRVAPVQLAGWGHPVTTGSNNIDGYLTCGAMEPADAQAHYVEKLLMLPGLGVDYAMPAPVTPLPRSALGLPQGKRLYVCAQSLFKVHPDMDNLLARIVAGDEGALLLFFQAPARTVTEQFGDRVQHAFEAHGIQPEGQLKFLPRMDAVNFRRLLAAADVVIDTVHWSGGNTSLDALSVGTPVVTWPGRFMRGRQTAAMLTMMGLEELIATDADSYVRLAIGVASDRERNRALREAIGARRDVLFGRPEPLAALSATLLALGAGSRP